MNKEEKLKRKREQSKVYYLKNKEKRLQKIKEYKLNNIDKIKKSNKNYQIKNKEEILKKQKEYRENILDKEKSKEYQKNYYENNKEIIIEKNKLNYHKNRENIKIRQRNYQRERRKKDINYKIKCNLRNRLYCAVKTNQKLGSAVKDLGCSVEKFKLWIEMHWSKEMSWDNYGQKGWHIDHITPLCQFDLTDSYQFIKASHFTNLQPLWAEDNYSKNRKIRF